MISRVGNEIEGFRLECSLFFQLISCYLSSCLDLKDKGPNTWFVSNFLQYSKHCSFFVDLVNGTKSIASYLHLIENSMKGFSNYIESYLIKCDDISKESL